MGIVAIRIEKDGIGLFTNMHSNKLAQQVYNRHSEFANPQQDGLDLCKDGKGWYCAYKSAKELKEWINTQELQYFISKGYNILQLEVEEYQIGDEQLLYTEESIVNCIDITNKLV